VLDEGRLADAGFAGHDDERRGAAGRVRQRAVEHRKLAGPADHGRPEVAVGTVQRTVGGGVRSGRRRWAVRRRADRRVAVGGGQGHAVQRLGFGGRRDAEVFSEGVPHTGVRGQRRGGTPGTQVGTHQRPEGDLVVGIVTES
jgi:hypothetical protein